ncbi:MAG: hypothetical protein V3R52_04415 [Candidatus Neomarinimicrobiota bacterium]
MKLFFGLALILNILLSQPDSRFAAFDWILYRQTGGINSITEGYDHAYFATENAGILRFELYQDRFAEPLTTAQGLSDNQILAVHFDFDTRILWVASQNFIDYSYNATDTWFHINLAEIGLHRDSYISQIGSSNNYIWLNAGGTFFKLDKVSGIVMGILPLPDEHDINWSSKRQPMLEIPHNLKKYLVIDGWIINDNQFIDSFGRTVTPTCFYFGRNNEAYIGTNDGTIFKGDGQMETFYPFSFGLNSTDITAFTKGNNFWIVGRDNYQAKGITSYDFGRNQFKYIDYEQTINFRSQPFFSALETVDEVWFGGNSSVSIYNKKRNFWREITEANGILTGIITAMVEDTSSVWIGTTNGLAKVSKINKRAERLNFVNLLSLRRINDLEFVNGNLWIATDISLLIYNSKNKSLINFKSYGNTEYINERKNIFSNFTDIYQNGNEAYISTPTGILKYDIQNEYWTVILEPSAYAGSKVNNLVIANGYTFLGTDNGFWQINFNDGYSELYDYPFIGSVQDMYIQGNTLLIGSDNGLIKYLWK